VEKTAIASLIFVIFLCAAHVPVLAEGQRTAGEVKYISGTSVYIDVGEADGLAPGDTVSVVRGGSVLGRLIVTATAAHSSSCAPEGSLGDIKVGDRIIRAGSERLPEEELPRIPAREKTAGTSMAANLMHGRVAIGSLISEDLTSSGLDFSQPSMNARLKVENLGGMPLTLDLRQRLRYLGQGRQVAPDLEENRWANRVYELALVYEEDESPLTLRFGRFVYRLPEEERQRKNPHALRGIRGKLRRGNRGQRVFLLFRTLRSREEIRFARQSGSGSE
jgi:hypothetical protein